MRGGTLNWEEILELANCAALQVERTRYGDTFIAHQNHRIFFKWHQKYDQWFFTVHRVGGGGMAGGYPALGWDWFDSWGAWEDGIAWGKRLISASSLKVRNSELHLPGRS